MSSRGAAVKAILVGVMVLSLLPLTLVQAQGRDYATYKAADRQAVLAAAARQEGQITIYTDSVAASIDPVVEAFRAAYPFVRVEVYQAGGAEVVQRVLEESRAGRNVVDVVQISAESMRVLSRAGLLRRFYSPEFPNYAHEAVEWSGEFGRWAVVRESHVGLGYNTRVYSATEVPKTYKDLLDAKWKGKLSVAGGGDTSIQWLGLLLSQADLGQAFVTRLAQQDVKVQVGNPRALLNLTIAGEAPISPTIYDSHVIASRAQGAPVAWVALEPAMAVAGVVGLPLKAAHPAAGALFVDFMLSRTAQLVLQKNGYGSAYKGITEGASYKRWYVGSLPAYEQRFDQWKKIFLDQFVYRK